MIITDVAGREPMVIVPLEQFEALAGEGGHVAPEEAEARPEPHSEPIPESRGEVQSRSISHPSKIADVLVQQNGVGGQHENVPSEMSVEEGFYLEPIDDKT